MGIHRPEGKKSFSKNKGYMPEIYEIMVQEILDNSWSQWFNDMTIMVATNPENGTNCSLISGKVVDQVELHGLLVKIRDLNLTLLSVRRVNTNNKRKKYQTRLAK